MHGFPLGIWPSVPDWTLPSSKERKRSQQSRISADILEEAVALARTQNCRWSTKYVFVPCKRA